MNTPYRWILRIQRKYHTSTGSTLSWIMTSLWHHGDAITSVHLCAPCSVLWLDKRGLWIKGRALVCHMNTPVVNDMEYVAICVWCSSSNRAHECKGIYRKVRLSAPLLWQKKNASRSEENLYPFVLSRLARNLWCRRDNIIAEPK